MAAAIKPGKYETALEWLEQDVTPNVMNLHHQWYVLATVPFRPLVHGV
jgi:hypothetical protein